MEMVTSKNSKHATFQEIPAVPVIFQGFEEFFRTTWSSFSLQLPKACNEIIRHAVFQRNREDRGVLIDVYEHVEEVCVDVRIIVLIQVDFESRFDISSANELQEKDDSILVEGIAVREDGDVPKFIIVVVEIEESPSSIASAKRSDGAEVGVLNASDILTIIWF
jgi:hypothetical protein